jgi:prepilin peptidase CpaA
MSDLNLMTLRYVAVIAIALTGCITDLRSRRIPNLLTFGGAIAAVIFHTIVSGGAGLLAATGGWIAAGALFFAPFALGGMGGGDLKLVAALGAWLGPQQAIWITLYTGVAGGIMALVVASARGYLGQALSNLWLVLAHWRVAGVSRVHEVSLEGGNGPRLAYALPIFVGTVMTIWLRS